MNFDRAAGWLVLLDHRRALLLAFCCVAFALRLFRLDAQSLWYDEGFSAWLSAQPLDQIVARTSSDIHPPLYYFLLRFWTGAGGQSEFTLRYLSMTASVLAVPAIYVLGRRLLDERTGWIAAAIATMSPANIWYAQEARMYSLLVLLTLLSTYAFWRWTEGARGRWWLACTLCNVLAVYLHFFAFFIVAFQFLYFLAWWVRQETRWSMLGVGVASTLAVLVAYLPWAQYVVLRMAADQSYFEGTLPPVELVRKSLILFATGHSVIEQDALPAALMFAVLAFFGWVTLPLVRSDMMPRTDENPFRPPTAASTAVRWFLLMYWIVPFVLLYVVSFDRPKFHPRYLMIAWPPFSILMAAGIGATLLAFRRSRGNWRGKFAIALGTAIAVFITAVSLAADAGLYFDQRFSKDDIRSAVMTIKAKRTADEPTILVSGHMFPVYSYYDSQGSWMALPDEPTLDTRRLLGYNVAFDLNRGLSGKSGAWLLLWQADVVDPAGFVTTILDAHASRIPQPGSFWGVQLLHYEIPPGTVFSGQPQIQHPLKVYYGGQIELLGYDLPTSPSPADKGVDVTLYWRSLTDLKKDYYVALRINDAEGRPVGKVDGRPSGYNYPTTRWRPGDVLFGRFQVPVEMATPPGEYFMEVVLYASDSLEGLDVLDEAAHPAGKAATIKPVMIGRPSVRLSVDKLRLKHPQRFDFAGTIEMLGFELDRTKAEPGEPIGITIFWRARATPKVEYRVLFDLRRDSDQTNPLAPSDISRALIAGLPTVQWLPGDVFRGQYTVFVPRDLSGGLRTLRLKVIDGSGPVGPEIVLGNFQVEPSTRTFRFPSTIQTTEIRNFDNTIQFYGYSILPAPVPGFTGLPRTVTVARGGRLQLTIYWRPLQTLQTSYHVFVHLHVPGQPASIVAQQDSSPVGGQRPTTTWIPGEFIADRYELDLRAGTPAGSYTVTVGLYDPRTGQRLPVGPTTSRANSHSLEDILVLVK